MNSNLKKDKQTAIEFINNGGKAVYRYGWAYKGANAHFISKEEALKKLSQGYDFGKGFYELSWITYQGETVLEFNELSENDMW